MSGLWKDNFGRLVTVFLLRSNVSSQDLHIVSLFSLCNLCCAQNAARKLALRKVGREFSYYAGCASRDHLYAKTATLTHP